jgi:hypothetical protein
MFRDMLKTPTVATCRYRSDVRVEGSIETASCALVKGITGVEDDGWCRVRREICEACCRSFPPSPAQLNPVVASRVYGVASDVLAAGGVRGCDVSRASGVRDAALRDLDVAHPDVAEPQAPEGGAMPALSALIPPPPRRTRAKVRTWAVGVTTAPRRQATLERCLDSLSQAGWPTPCLFIDSAVNVPERFAHLPGTFRDARLGAWPSYYLALTELLMRQPDADAVMIVQDDALFPQSGGVRLYLEETLWPGRRAGLVSLYCSSAYTKPDPGWYAHPALWVWGALAFVFPRDLAREFVVDPQVFAHRWDPVTGGRANIDYVIGRWALRRRVAVWHTTPSLVQHVGESSVLWPTTPATGPRSADCFAGDRS